MTDAWDFDPGNFAPLTVSGLRALIQRLSMMGVDSLVMRPDKFDEMRAALFVDQSLQAIVLSRVDARPFQIIRGEESNGDGR